MEDNNGNQAGGSGRGVWEVLNSRFFTTVVFVVFLSLAGFAYRSLSEHFEQKHADEVLIHDAQIELEARCRQLWRINANTAAHENHPVTYMDLRRVLQGGDEAVALPRFRNVSLDGLLAMMEPLALNEDKPSIHRAMGARIVLGGWLDFPKSNKDLAGNQLDIKAVLWLGFEPWIKGVSAANRAVVEDDVKNWVQAHKETNRLIAEYDPTDASRWDG